MDKAEKIVMLKLDVIFKRVFGDENNKDIIAAFISDLLEIPRSSIRSIYINNGPLSRKRTSKREQIGKINKNAAAFIPRTVDNEPQRIW